MITKDTIKERIIEGDLKEAIRMLLKITEQYSTDAYNEAIMFSSRYRSLMNDVNHSMITNQEASISRNRLNFALTQFLSKIKDNWRVVEGVSSGPSNSVKSDLKKVLFLGASPKDQIKLRLDEEVRKIENALQLSQHRDAFEFTTKWAVQIPDFRRAVLDLKPNIIHFSGHGSSSGKLIFEDVTGHGKEIPPKAIGDFMELFKEHVECVMLTACYSEAQAQEIAKHIPYVVGTNSSIADDASIAFSEAFYDAVGSGLDFSLAFKIGRNAIAMSGLGDSTVPILLNAV